MSAILFHANAGRPEPIQPIDSVGRLVAPDNATIFSIEQAAAHFGTPVEQLRKLWNERFPHAVQTTDPFGRPEEQPLAVGTIRSKLPESVQLTLLHQLQYPDLTVEEFELYVATCEQNHLSAFCRHLVPTIQMEEGRRRLVIITTIEVLRMIAQLHPGYLGRSAIQFCGADEIWKDLWLSDEPPAASRCTMYRKQGEDRLEFPEHARWAAYAPYMIGEGGEFTLPPYWEKFKPEQLGKCCEARALRAAFGSTLRGLYIREEMEQARAAAHADQKRIRQTGTGGAASPESQIRAFVDDAAESQLDFFELMESAPADEADFDQKLSELIPHAQVRIGVVDAYRKKWPVPYRQNRRAFWAAVLTSVKERFARVGSN